MLYELRVRRPTGCSSRTRSSILPLRGACCVPVASNVRNSMSAWISLISFHVALFVCVSMVVFYVCVNTLRSIDSSFYVVWLCLTVAAVAAISTRTGVNLHRRWDSAPPNGSTLVLVVGHLGTLVAGSLYAAMTQAGTGSGLALLLPMTWAVLFYLIGIVWTVVVLNGPNVGNK